MPVNPVLERVLLCQDRLAEALDQYRILVNTLYNHLCDGDEDIIPSLIQEEIKSRELVEKRTGFLSGFKELLTVLPPEVVEKDQNLKALRLEVLETLKSVTTSLRIRKNTVKNQLNLIKIPQRIKKTCIERVIPERIDITL